MCWMHDETLYRWGRYVRRLEIWDGIMDMQFEVDGAIVDLVELDRVLGSSSVGRAVRRVAERITQEAGSVCDQHRESPAVTIVISGTHGIGVRVGGCCQAFVNKVQEQVKTVFMHSARLSASGAPGMNLIISVRGTDKKYEFEAARIERLVIGRRDPDTGLRPDIDLEAFGAYDNGVSRRHASILMWNRGLFLLDEGTPNGTFLNEERLRPNDPRPLKFGDHVRIGKLVLEITLDYPAGTA